MARPEDVFNREALEGLTSENVLPRALAGAQQRFEAAEQNLATHGPLPDTSGQPVPGTHPAGPPPLVKHTPPAAPGDIPPGEPHLPVIADSPPPVVTDPGHPEFTLDNPLHYMTPELQALSEQHLTGSGETVLGPFKPPRGGLSYIDLAKLHKASYFDLGDAWYSFTPTEQLAANQHVLDVAIANRDKITLSVPFYRIVPNTYTAAEIRYLEAHGYQRVGDNALLPPINEER